MEKPTAVRYFTALGENLVYEVDLCYEATVTTEAGETITALGGSINDEGFWIDKAAILAAERARIRKELLKHMRDWANAGQWSGLGATEREHGARAALVELQAALDRIVPEGKE